MSQPAAPPSRIAAPDGGTEYVLRPGLYALHGGGPGGAAPLLELEEDGVRVFEGEAPAGDPSAGPVYALGGGSLAVPTGRVLVRFAEGVDAAARAAELEGAGFAVAQVLSYAPHAAWVAPATRQVADALRGIAALRAVPGVEHVEPQWLMARASR